MLYGRRQKTRNKSDRVHVVPLVPQAIEILRSMLKPTEGPYIISSRKGRMPIKGVAKFFRTTLSSQILANKGARLPKKLASHALRRTVATRLAELLGDEGDKLVKRVLGHSGGSVTAIYNRYGYIREMRRALEMWANELTGEAVCRISELPMSPSAGDARNMTGGAVVANVSVPKQ